MATNPCTVVRDPINAPLYVIAPVFNPIRFRSRLKHYMRFAKYVVDSGAILVTIEAAFGDREFALEGIAPTHVTEARWNPNRRPHQYIKVRTNSELWTKENLLNLGMHRLPSDAEYVAWWDADVMFARPNIVGETIHQLQHYALVQCWSEAYDLGPRYATIAAHRSFMWCYCHEDQIPSRVRTGLLRRQQAPYYYPQIPREKGQPYFWHPGYAVAARRSALDALGGLIDFAILGAADHHMMKALIGRVDEAVHPDIHPRYRERLREWERTAERVIRRNVGYVSGTLLHFYHGTKISRRYWDRWKILVKNQYNPDTDFKYDTQGLMYLVDDGSRRMAKMRDEIQAYFRQRNEDTQDLEGGVMDLGGGMITR